MRRPNVLFLTLDQFRADHLGCAGHPLVRTPNLDALAAAGVRLARHYSQAAPCAPGRACLYTGTYQANNRVVANGTPLDARFDNLALMARRAGYTPTLFGYTDQAVDPRTVPADDPRLREWEGVLPGFDCELELTESHAPWMAWLAELGYDEDDPIHALATEHRRPAEHSVTTFTTDRVLQWLDRRPTDEPWFAHVSYLRPHPPYSAPGDHAGRYDADAIASPLPIPDDDHPLLGLMLANPEAAAPRDPVLVARMRQHYLGMITHLDEQLGRLWDALRARGEWDDTVIVVTSDHGEQLGDQGLVQKLGWFDASYHIPGIVRDPHRPQGHGTTVDAFTENVDVFPTLCELVGEPIPRQCDGRSLVPWLDGAVPGSWRDAAVHEWDWRDQLLHRGATDRWPDDRRLHQLHLTVRRTADQAYVQFGDGSWRCYDLAADPGYGVRLTDPAVVLGHAQALLAWRQEISTRELTGVLITPAGPVG